MQIVLHPEIYQIRLEETVVVYLCRFQTNNRLVLPLPPPSFASDLRLPCRTNVVDILSDTTLGAVLTGRDSTVSAVLMSINTNETQSQNTLGTLTWFQAVHNLNTPPPLPLSWLYYTL